MELDGSIVCFRGDYDAPPEYENLWLKLKDHFYHHLPPEDLLKYCKLESNRNLPVLDRAEGGFGGNSNQENKQIRVFDYKRTCDFSKDKICFILYDSQNKNEKWTFEEVNDIMNGIVKYFNEILGQHLIGSTYIHSYIRTRMIEI